jgi:phosphoribosylanthranilate isomerase
MMATRIKICGITRAEDARHAAALGVDAIGLVFYAASPRYVSIEQADAVVAVVPPFVTVVGLFVDAAPGTVRAVLKKVPVDLLQFHGDESPDYCRQFARPWLKAIRMRGDVDLAAEAARYKQASGLLLDAYRPGIPGGTGESFEWSRVPQNSTLPIVLAGGLTPDNVGEAIGRAHPFAVDVSGGVELARGVKDQEKMAAFMTAVRTADGCQLVNSN